MSSQLQFNVNCASLEAFHIKFNAKYYSNVFTFLIDDWYVFSLIMELNTDFQITFDFT